MIFLLFVSVLWNAPPSPAVLEESIQDARSEFDSGKYKAAVKTLTSALAESPEDSSVHYWIARSYYELRDYDSAVNHAEIAVKLAPQDAEYNRWLGRAYGAKAEKSHSFFIARKVKQAFEAAVRLAPASIVARRDLMQYLAEAPWIVGGDKEKARQQIEAIAALDPIQGRLARAAYLAADKQWKGAETEYLSIMDQHPSHIDPYMEAAAFFADRRDPKNLERAVEAASRVNAHDAQIGYYRAVFLILKGTESPTAEQLLRSYMTNVPERSDYPSHNSAMEWLRRIGH
ncbi:MAG: hypothetical protein DMG13_14190 [Acidobacteria bacterium]|nr:MAG: hypothetical protein DMG13_14190 [Acidobacteriota bacterium]